jgi:hypothetical protein
MKKYIFIALIASIVGYKGYSEYRVNSLVTQINKSFYFKVECKRDSNNLNCIIEKKKWAKQEDYKMDLVHFKDWREKLIDKEFKKRGISGKIEFKEKA